MTIWTPSFWTRYKAFYTGLSNRPNHAGDWEVEDYGWIKYVKGDAWRIRVSGASGGDLYIGQSGAFDDDSPKYKSRWGIKLLRYDDRWGTNDMGLGEILQPWCVAIEPGKITWNKVTMGDLCKRVQRVGTGNSTNAPH
jgi:hypothetical protein